MSLTPATQTDAVRSAKFRYLAPTVENSLYRNGQVFVYRDTQGNESDLTGVDIEEREMPVQDA